MKFEKALKKAKLISFKDYDDECKKHNSDTTYNATRTWQPCKFKNCSGYSLSGTPPKAYLMISNGKIFCKRALSQESFKVIDFEDEPSGSPSVSSEAEE